jgi:putative thioredoxin
MAVSPYVFDATRENFASLVLENSRKGPVAVHFWSAKAPPCYVLMPRLVRLATEYGGKFLLVMANTDDLPGIARQYGVASVPTVKFFRHGQVMHTIHGAESDARFREALDRFIAGDAERTHAVALQLYGEGKVRQAIEMLAHAAMADPDDLTIPADLARILMAQEEYGNAAQLLRSLPPQAQHSPNIEPLLAHLEFIEASMDAASAEELEQRIASRPEDVEAHFLLAAKRLVADDYEAAMSHLLEIARHDRAHRNDIGRRGLIALFNLLGPEHTLTQRYRRALFETLG